MRNPSKHLSAFSDCHKQTIIYRHIGLYFYDKDYITKVLYGSSSKRNKYVPFYRFINELRL